MKLEEAIYQFVQWQFRGTNVLYLSGNKAEGFLCKVDEVGRDFLLLNRPLTDEIFLVGGLDKAQFHKIEHGFQREPVNVVCGIRFTWADGPSCCLLETTGACSLVADSRREEFLKSLVLDINSDES